MIDISTIADGTVPYTSGKEPETPPKAKVFLTERDAVSALITIARDRAQARQLSAEAKKFKASADANTAAVIAFMAGHDLTQLEDREHELTVTRYSKPKPRKMDMENLPNDLLAYLAERGGVSAVLGVIDKLPESTTKDRVMRFIGPGGESKDLLSFGDGEEEDA